MKEIAVASGDLCPSLIREGVSSAVWKSPSGVYCVVTALLLEKVKLGSSIVWTCSGTGGGNGDGNGVKGGL